MNIKFWAKEETQQEKVPEETTQKINFNEALEGFVSEERFRNSSLVNRIAKRRYNK